MKLEIKTNKNGVCEYFKIDGKKFGVGIYSVDIHIGNGLPQVIIKAKSDEFILDSEDNKLYLEKYKNKLNGNEVE